MPRFIVHPGTDNEFSVEIPDGPVTIGRAESNQIDILDKSLSRVHARLERNGRKIILHDLNSTNGTEVNSARITSCELFHNDLVRCGDVYMTYVEDPRILKEVVLRQTMSLTGTLGHDTNFGATMVLQSGQPEDNIAAQRLSILLQVAEALSSPDDIHHLLERVVDLLFQIMDVDRAVLLIKKESGELVPRVARTRDGTDKPTTIPPVEQHLGNVSESTKRRGNARQGNDDGSDKTPSHIYSRQIVDYVLERNVAVLTSDAHADSRFRASASILMQSIRASMCAPIRRGDNVLGVLYVDNVTTPDRYMDDDLEFLGAFASQAAIAIENSRLYKKIEAEAVLKNNFLRFFPPNTIKRLIDTEIDLDVIETEVTAVFADISNFTAMSATMRPIDIVEMLNDYFPVMSEIVFKYEGTLEKYIGDALLVVWGAPFSHEDDVERAIQASIEMQQALQGLNERWQGRRHLSIHVGINTGPVAAGNIGSERYIQYATIGDTTNVAARICSVAGEDEIVISESTAARLGHTHHVLEKLAPVAVKGKSEPLTLYRLDWQSATVLPR